MRTNLISCLIMALLAVLFYACSSPTDTTADRHDQVVMDWSEKFASAVEIYPKEEGRLMERVARCWLEELDNPVQALRVAREIPNWRQAVMLADIARVLAGIRNGSRRRWPLMRKP
jgi:hypothetical protein